MKASKRIEEELYGALENFLCIGDYEYIFYPHSPEKEIMDFSGGRLLLEKELRDADGKVYTVEGEGSHINIITIDINFDEAIRMFEESAKEVIDWYTLEQINEIRDEIINERR